MFALLGKCLGQIFYTLRIRSYALTYAQQIRRGNMNIATLRACMVIPRCGIKQFHTEEMTEDSLIDQCLTLTHLKAHRVDEHTVVDRRRGISGKEQVVERLQQIAVIGKAIPLLFLHTFDQDARQLLTVQLHQMLKHAIDHLLLLRRAPVVAQTLDDQMLTHSHVVKQFAQYVSHIIDIRPPLQHPAEQSVFAVDSRFVHDVAIEPGWR